MKRTAEQWMWEKLSRLRICILLVLLCTAAFLLWEPPGAIVENVEYAAEAGVQMALEGLTVAVDPGHGGYDGGARAHDSGRWEKDVTLEIALEVEKALKAFGADVVMTRREDVCLCQGNTATKARKRQDLQARIDIALAAQADLFVSIHLNEYRSRKESGPQVFYQRGGEAGKALAKALQEALVQQLRPAKTRVAMAGDYYVLRSKLPSALVECGFLSNGEEEKLLLSQEYQQKIALSITQGVQVYWEGNKNQSF